VCAPRARFHGSTSFAWERASLRSPGRRERNYQSIAESLTTARSPAVAGGRAGRRTAGLRGTLAADFGGLRRLPSHVQESPKFQQAAYPLKVHNGACRRSDAGRLRGGLRDLVLTTGFQRASTTLAKSSIPRGHQQKSLKQLPVHVIHAGTHKSHINVFTCQECARGRWSKSGQPPQMRSRRAVRAVHCSDPSSMTSLLMHVSSISA
jgi:hypothetical protein